MKCCKKCKEEKGDKEFRKYDHRPTRDNVCRSCRKENNKVNWQKANSFKIRRTPVLDDELFKLFQSGTVMPPMIR